MGGGVNGRPILAFIIILSLFSLSQSTYYIGRSTNSLQAGQGMAGNISFSYEFPVVSANGTAAGNISFIGSVYVDEWTSNFANYTSLFGDYQIEADITSFQSGSGTVIGLNITFKHRFPGIVIMGDNNATNMTSVHTSVIGAWFKQDFVIMPIHLLIIPDIFTEDDTLTPEAQTTIAVSIVVLSIFVFFWVKPDLSAFRRKKKEIFIYEQKGKKP
jgi:hypothetical protein